MNGRREGMFWDVMEGRRSPPPAAELLGWQLRQVDPAAGRSRWASTPGSGSRTRSAWCRAGSSPRCSTTPWARPSWRRSGRASSPRRSTSTCSSCARPGPVRSSATGGWCAGAKRRLPRRRAVRRGRSHRGDGHRRRPRAARRPLTRRRAAVAGATRPGRCSGNVDGGAVVGMRRRHRHPRDRRATRGCDRPPRQVRELATELEDIGAVVLHDEVRRVSSLPCFKIRMSRSWVARGADRRRTRPGLPRPRPPYTATTIRGVAQPGSAPALGAGGRGFESRLPDSI